MTIDSTSPFAATDRVVDNPERSRFELFSEGQLVGFLSYRASSGVLVLDHAEIDPADRGTGRGAQLVRSTLDDLMRRGFVIRAACPFVARFIAEHPEYQGLVAR
jgi:uncharacterized protein